MICGNHDIQEVIGLGFGDEGKGRMVSYLCSSDPSNSLVIRFSGGPQAAHRVVINNDEHNDKIEHIFSHFGSGTLQGVPTYWSNYCTIELSHLINEYLQLERKISNNVEKPIWYFHPDCPMITPYDILLNEKDENNKHHGTCGFGHGKTIKREQEFHLSLTASDLLNPSAFELKWKMIQDYYLSFYYDKNIIDKQEENTKFQRIKENFKNYILWFREYVDNKIFIMNKEIPTFNIKTQTYRKLIFEGSQGILLDEDYGFFPHVTRSKTSNDNIYSLLSRVNNYDTINHDIFAITRAYQMRHGNGPMTNENIHNGNFQITFHGGEKNIYNQFQGNSRTSILDLNLLEYSLGKIINLNKYNKNISLVVTCLDHVKGKYMYTQNGNVYEFDDKKYFLRDIKHILGVDKLYYSESECGNIILFEN